jgi:aldehyde:ferredoxin oxidoreductase
VSKRVFIFKEIGRVMSRKYERVLIVNLESQSSRTMGIDPEILKKFIGGAGLSAYLYSQFVKGDVPPLDPASPFLIMTGPLTGTPVILSGRHGVAGRGSFLCLFRENPGRTHSESYPAE